MASRIPRTTKVLTEAQENQCLGLDICRMKCQNTSERFICTVAPCTAFAADVELLLQFSQEINGTRCSLSARAQHAPAGCKPKVILRIGLAASKRAARHAVPAHPHRALTVSSMHRLDMASFVTTWMDPEAEALIAETQAVNIVDTSQYPQCTEMEQRWVALPIPVSNAIQRQLSVYSTAQLAVKPSC